MIVMPRYDKTLHEVIDKESRGDNWPEQARGAFKEVAESLIALHHRGFAHGDVKPRNIIRTNSGEGYSYRLIDLDAARPLGTGVIGPKLSYAYAPPEVLAQRAPCPQCSQRPLVWRQEPPNSPPPNRAFDEDPLPVAESFDVWCLGATLFHMLARRELFSTDLDDNFKDGDVDALELLNWSDELCAQKLRYVPAGIFGGEFLCPTHPERHFSAIVTS